MLEKSLKVTDFTGQKLYVGLDVHVNSWTVSVYSEEFELKTFTQPADVGQLLNWLHQHYAQADIEVAYEAGFCGFYIQRALVAQGIKCRVIHPVDVPASDKERKRKTDRIDSRRLAKGLKNGVLNAIFVPSINQQADRELLRARSRLVADTTVVKNRIKAFLKFNGIGPPKQWSKGGWSKAMISWLSELPLHSYSSRATLKAWIKELQFLTRQQQSLLRQIQQLADTPAYAKQIALLESIPAIGLLTAMTFLTEIGDIHRFKNLDRLCSFCGLSPNSYSSGDHARITGISRRGNATIKHMLIECAWMAIRKDPALLLYYKSLLARMNTNKAIIKVTRKLLARIRAVLHKQQAYVTGVIA